MRSAFPCGHRGLGQACHRCAQQERDVAEAHAAEQALRADRAAWAATFDADVIDLRPLQLRSRVLRAREILRRVAAGETVTELGGRRRQLDREMIVIKLGMGYRLLLREIDGALRPVACMTHEAYNALKPGAYSERRVSHGC